MAANFSAPYPCHPLHPRSLFYQGRPLKSLSQFFLEKINRPLPGQFSGSFIVTGRGIIMKPMVHSRIIVGGVRFILLP